MIWFVLFTTVAALAVYAIVRSGPRRPVCSVESCHKPALAQLCMQELVAVRVCPRHFDLHPTRSEYVP